MGESNESTGSHDGAAETGDTVAFSPMLLDGFLSASLSAAGANVGACPLGAVMVTDLPRSLEVDGSVFSDEVAKSGKVTLG